MASAIYMDEKLLDHIMKTRAMIVIVIDNENELDGVVKDHLLSARNSLEKLLGWVAQ